jgi:hypothetical protein
MVTSTLVIPFLATVIAYTPPSIAIEALVLGGPEVVRVVLNSSSSSLDQGRRPSAYSSYIGSSPVSFTAEEAESAALAHVLGIVREPTEWFRPTMALTRPLLQATLSMVAAAIHASKKTLQAAHIVCRRRTQLHRALEQVRYHTWTHLKPAGAPCCVVLATGLAAAGCGQAACWMRAGSFCTGLFPLL